MGLDDAQGVDDQRSNSTVAAIVGDGTQEVDDKWGCISRWWWY